VPCRWRSGTRESAATPCGSTWPTSPQRRRDGCSQAADRGQAAVQASPVRRGSGVRVGHRSRCRRVVLGMVLRLLLDPDRRRRWPWPWWPGSRWGRGSAAAGCPVRGHHVAGGRGQGRWPSGRG
jgi:hypothetical protein